MKLYSILPDALQEYNNKKNQAIAGLDFSMLVNKREPAYLSESGVGIISVYGPLLRDSTALDRELGSTDYDELTDEMDDLVENGAKVIIFVYDSPGGTVAGLAEVGDKIMNLQVPTVAYIEGLGTSAAYYLAAASTIVMGSKSSISGNIGAVMSFADTSKFYERMGIEMNVFTNSGADNKSIGYNFSLSESQKQFLQASIDETGKKFQDWVMMNRPELSTETFNAAWYSSDKALELNVLDDIGDMKKAWEYAISLASI